MSARAQQPTFRERLDIVSVDASVISDDGTSLTDLTAAEFELWDDGARRTIAMFSRERRSITVAMVVDNSPSAASSVKVRQAALVAFISGLEQGDRAGVRTVTESVQPVTDDFKVLRAALPRAMAAERHSPIWLAVETAVRELQPLAGSRAVLVFTDALNTSPGLTPPELLTLARGTDVALYAAMPANTPWSSSAAGGTPVADRLAIERAQEQFRMLVRDTGGRPLALTGSIDNVERAFRKLSDELRYKYLLGFTPDKLDGKFHSIRLRVTRPDARVVARTGYIAPAK